MPPMMRQRLYNYVRQNQVGRRTLVATTVLLMLCPRLSSALLTMTKIGHQPELKNGYLAIDNRMDLLPSRAWRSRLQEMRQRRPRSTSRSSSGRSDRTQLWVWWYGGSESTEPVDQDADSCELVAVRIERTSPNSRRIFGEITVPTPLSDVWAILTDYDRLVTHVPNLMESRIVSRNSGGSPGDGQFQCRLFQRGAQKIIGFEFGASVTMDMKEIVVTGSSPLGQPRNQATNLDVLRVPNGPESFSSERRIIFKCADSFFFSEFDGEWRARERVIPGEANESVETILSYVVDVRPKGPVPVAALEWRIREDVPTNLRAVKRASMMANLSQLGTMMAAGRNGTRDKISNNAVGKPSTSGRLSDLKDKIKWYRDETMAAYLADQ